MVGIGRLKSLLLLTRYRQKERVQTCKIERGVEEEDCQIKEKDKWVCAITTTFLISDLIPNFASLPSLPSSPKIIPSSNGDD